jgi:hypothetical protein
MPDPFRPGIPTNRQNTGGKTTYTNADLRRPSMQGVYDAALQAQMEQETYERLNAQPDEPSVDELLRQSRETLSEVPSSYRQLQNRTGDEGAAREQVRLEAESSPITAVRNAARIPLAAASFVPGPIGIGAGGALALEGLYSAATEGFDPLSTPLNLAAGLPLARGARGMLKAAPASRMYGPMRKPGSMATSNAPIPNVEHYWDALDLGVDPAKAAKIAAGRDKASLSALKSLQEGGNRARSAPSVDLTDELEGLVDPLAKQRGRAAERFGKTYRSETSNPPGPARSVPKRRKR